MSRIKTKELKNRLKFTFKRIKRKVVISYFNLIEGKYWFEICPNSSFDTCHSKDVTCEVNKRTSEWYCYECFAKGQSYIDTFLPDFEIDSQEAYERQKLIYIKYAKPKAYSL
jgi:hypothetical protein